MKKELTRSERLDKLHRRADIALFVGVCGLILAISKIIVLPLIEMIGGK